MFEIDFEKGTQVDLQKSANWATAGGSEESKAARRSSSEPPARSDEEQEGNLMSSLSPSSLFGIELCSSEL